MNKIIYEDRTAIRKTVSDCFPHSLSEHLRRMFMEYSKIGFIYLITNSVNNKLYVGKTTKLPKHRLQDHIGYSKRYSKSSAALPLAIRKYGSHNFSVKPLQICSIDTLSENEIKWIAKLDTYNNGYNCTIGGEGTVGKKLSESQKIAISKCHKGKVISEEHRRKCSESQKDKIVLDSTKQLLSSTMKRYWETYRNGTAKPRKQRKSYDSSFGKQMSANRRTKIDEFTTKWTIIGTGYKIFPNGKQYKMLLAQCEKCAIIIYRPSNKHKQFMYCKNCNWRKDEHR